LQAKDGTGMNPDIPALAEAQRGTTANGVPFVALPPEGGRQATGVVILWHGADPPRTEEALAAAVPLRELPAWRIYLGLPLSGQRLPEGGVDEIMRRGREDAVSLLFQPMIEGAVAELPAALDEVRTQLGIDAALPLGIFGFSVGGAAALLAVSRRVLPLKAAVTFGAVPDVPALVDVAAAFFQSAYKWTGGRLALARGVSTVQRGAELAKSGAAILLGVGAADPYPARGPAEQLATAINSAGGKAELRTIPDLAHGFVDEPGSAAVPQGPQAKAVDELATEWFLRHLA
jgi:dienelactone hydrolase